METTLQLQNNNITNENSGDMKYGRFRVFLNKLVFLRMTKEKKAEIANEILTETYDSKLYRLEMVLSSLLATLGLLTNSVPVIIGAMLIAPILQPIKAFSFAVSTGNKHLYFKAFKMLGLSILVAVVVAYLITLTVPFADLTSEVIARTSPTTVDLLIALGSGIIAILSLAFKRLSESIAGVAMAVALMPPLCVLGIGLQFMDIDVTMGSGLLFLTNLVSIIVVGVILFYTFGFFPTNKLGKKRSTRMTILIIFTIGILLIPLRKGMQTIAFNFKTNSVIYDTFDKYRGTVNQSIKFQKPNFQRISDERLKINATLNIPSSLKITDEHKQKLTQLLALKTHKSIDLQLNLIGVSSISIDPPTVSLDKHETKNNNSDIDEELFYIEKSIRDQFSMLFDEAELKNLSVKRGEIRNQILINIEFTSAWEKEKLNKFLSGWNNVLEKYFNKNIIMNVKIQFVSIWESQK